MERQSTRQNRRKNKKRKYVILFVEVFLLGIMLSVLWFVTKFTDEEEGVQRIEITENDITINDGVVKNDIPDETEEGPSYRTYALFGLDSTVGELINGTRSDTIMIATVNDDTKEVHLMSVYRDTYLNLGNDTYNKCNAAYARGGAKQAISMLNMNLDLDITDFIAVGFKGVMDAVNALGGVYIDVDSEELEHINDYQISISENLKTTYTPVTKTGYQLLDGLQATAYCRIRHTTGDDFKRTERQREVLLAMLEEAKKVNAVSLTKMANDVFGDVYTSVDLEEILTVLSDLGSYTIVDEGGFPSAEYRAGATIPGAGDSIVCTDLEAAVTELHQTVYGEENYVASKTLGQIHSTLQENTASYLR